MQHLAAINDPVLSPTTDFIVLDTRESLEDFMNRNLSADPSPWASFGVWLGLDTYNNTILLDIYLNQTNAFESFVQSGVSLPDYHNEFYQLLSRAIIGWGLQFETSPTQQTSISQWPAVRSPFGGNINDNTAGATTMLGEYYGLFFFLAFFLYFPITISEVNRERRLKLREGMEVMGLKVGVYWYASFTTHSIYTFLSSLIFCIFGLALRLEFFRFYSLV